MEYESKGMISETADDRLECFEIECDEDERRYEIFQA